VWSFKTCTLVFQAQHSKVDYVKVDQDTIDWRTKNAVNLVIDQSKCGAGWAFASIGALEAFSSILRSYLPKFSEQQLVDCSGSYGNQGCKGGSLLRALKYTSENGVILDSNYKYTGSEDTCKYDIDKVNGKNRGLSTANGDSVLKEAVDKTPVAVSIAADQDVFRFYVSGILDSANCGVLPNHAGLAVGYGFINDLGYWIVKNSWGENWGEQGYLRIARASGAGICGINTDNVYPTTRGD
jgi:cathepsin S